MKVSWNRIKREVFGDSRKFFIVASLLSVMLLLWGRLLLKDVPRSAVARPSVVAAAVGAVPVPSEPVIEADKNQRQVVEARLYGGIEHDLFLFQPNHYPVAGHSEGKVWEAAKSGSEEADELDQQHEYLAVMAAAQQLKLQSTMRGLNNRALINGVLLEPGQTISGFTLKEVRTRQVVLVKDGIEVVLEM